MRKGKERRLLIDQLVGEIDLPIPTDPDSLFTALLAIVSRIRGRHVELAKEEFPHRTASGLWLDLESYDLIVVDKRAVPVHQLAIFFHEVWHMLKGDCGHHVDGVAVAARMVSDRADLTEAVRRVAARTEFSTGAEEDAEKFALLALTQSRVWLEGSPDTGSMDRQKVAGRIGASLGHRRPQV